SSASDCSKTTNILRVSPAPDRYLQEANICIMIQSTRTAYLGSGATAFRVDPLIGGNCPDISLNLPTTASKLLYTSYGSTSFAISPATGSLHCSHSYLMSFVI